MSRPVEILRKHSRLTYTSLAALAGLVAGVVVRNRRVFHVSLPDPSVLAAETAASVRNAARGTVITQVRESDEPEASMIEDLARSAIEDAAGAGADITAVAIGIVEGVVDVAHLLGSDPRALAARTAHAVVAAAERQGAVAGARVRDLLEEHLTAASQRRGSSGVT